VRLESIHIYPLKATRAVDLQEARVEPWGLAGDRRWLLTNLAGRAVTQREEPVLSRVVVRYRPGSYDIDVSAAGQPPLAVAAPAAADGAEMTWAAVWGTKVEAAAAGPAADAWFSRLLGSPVRLVHLDDPTRRQVNPEYARPDDRVSFADGYPLLLTTSGSLERLGDWLSADGHRPVPMTRFRPNVVLGGTPPWAEDGWHRIRIGPVEFRVAKPCDRCVVTTVDQLTGIRGSQPLKMLGKHRRFPMGLLFGQNLIPDGTGVIRAGDEAVILA
jgi:uncharacterized protein YcbX